MPKIITKEDGVNLIPVHINKCRDETHFWDWKLHLNKWVRGKKIPEHLNRMYKNPKP